MKNITLFLLFALLIIGCDSENSQLTISSAPLTLIPSSHSGVNCKNEFKITYQNNSLTHDNIYAGAGVAIGDINNDGLEDLVIVSNEGGSNLYLNEGDFKFKDISNGSGIEKDPGGWSTGVVLNDINLDGYLDIYICRGGEFLKNDDDLRRNLLYINNKDNTFTESAKSFGLDDFGQSVQASFFDYDLDGDLDLYVVNSILLNQEMNAPEIAQYRKNPKHYVNSDRLYRNQGNNKFEDVTKATGILNTGFGLDIAIFDYNKDLYPDIFITNDFATDNFLYINNKNGTYTEVARTCFNHTSYFAMGCDAADLDNNGTMDLFEVEMLPPDRKRAVLNMTSMNRGLFEQLESNNIVPQIMRNCLHMNNFPGRFSETGQLSPITKTDWSWGTILIDLDDDGYRDILVTNGILYDARNRDFAKSSNDIALQAQNQLSLEDYLKKPSTRVENYAFKNNGDGSFEKASKEFGFNYKGFSNGIAYGDLNNDGLIDYIVNNLEDAPLIYKGQSVGNNFVNFEFEGPKSNPEGIGANVVIYYDGQMQYHENYKTHGFQSSCQSIMHFGIGQHSKLDSAKITWPDGNAQFLTNIGNINTTIKVNYSDVNDSTAPKLTSIPKYFNGVSKAIKLNHYHLETYYDDYGKEILLPHKYSQLGPGIAVGGINDDVFDDFYIGGSAGYPGVMYLCDGRVYDTLACADLTKDSKHEDIAALFFDFDNDEDDDLYVVSGSNQFEIGSELYKDRLYINQGNNKFEKSSGILPDIRESGACVVDSDFDNDGDLDLFVGSRIVPGKYPLNPTSYLLINNNGKFTKSDHNFDDLGLVTSAIWTDYDGDNDDDLIVVGEWMPITVYENNKGKLSNVTEKLGLSNTQGWWYHINKADIDNDGDDDYIVGNIGSNHKFKGSEDKPFYVYYDDFDKSGNLDIVLAYHDKEKIFPVRGRDCTSEQMPMIKEKFKTFEDFGSADIYDVLGDDVSDQSRKEMKIHQSVFLRNDGGKFILEELPSKAQLGPINGTIVGDFNKDQHLDILAAGAIFQTEAETSKADANIGLLLLGDGQGNFKEIGPVESGFYTPGDVKSLDLINAGKNRIILVGNNHGKIQSFRCIADN